MEIHGNNFESDLTKKVMPTFNKEQDEKAYIGNIEAKVKKSSKHVQKLPFTPTNNGVIVAYDVVEETESGLIINKEDSLSEDVLLVLGVGPAVTSLKAGDTVIARAEARPIKFTYEGITYLHFREHDFIVVINETNR